MKRKTARAGGFTLTELMIMITIIGVLATIAMPKFAEHVRKSGEGSSKGNLGALRGALSIYYADMEGSYPATISALTVSGKYMKSIPLAKTPNYHADSSSSKKGKLGAADDAGNWLYDATPAGANAGFLWVNCGHTDSKGSVWTSY